MKKILLLAIVGLISFTACKKDDPIPAPTRTDFLTDNPWKIEKIGGTLADCYVDDIYNFRSDGIFVWNFGINKCAVTNPLLLDSISGDWVFLDDETKIETSVDFGVSIIKDTLSITKLDVDNLEYFRKGVNWTFKH